MGDLFRFTEFDGDISKWDVSSVTDLDFIFEDCPIPEEHKPKFKE